MWRDFFNFRCFFLNAKMPRFFELLRLYFIPDLLLLTLFLLILLLLILNNCVVLMQRIEGFGILWQDSKELSICLGHRQRSRTHSESNSSWSKVSSVTTTTVNFTVWRVVQIRRVQRTVTRSATETTLVPHSVLRDHLLRSVHRISTTGATVSIIFFRSKLRRNVDAEKHYSSIFIPFRNNYDDHKKLGESNPRSPIKFIDLSYQPKPRIMNNNFCTFCHKPLQILKSLDDQQNFQFRLFTSVQILQSERTRNL